MKEVGWTRENSFSECEDGTRHRELALSAGPFLTSQGSSAKSDIEAHPHTYIEVGV
jgi:hypothetical protein